MRSRHELASGDDFQRKANKRLHDRVRTFLAHDASTYVAHERVRGLRKDDVRNKAFEATRNQPLDPLDRGIVNFRSYNASNERTRIENRANGRRDPRG